MKTLYFDCFAGASGNMILGALISLGVDKDELIRQLNLLKIADFQIDFAIVDRAGISAVHANVMVPDEKIYRHLSDINQIIQGSDLTLGIKKRAVLIFSKLAEAEAKVHGIDIEKVHFHEVGAMDAIVDVVGACIGFDLLGIEKFACSKINVGSGFVQIAHGTYPIPPPAVAELLKGVSIYSTEIEGELITPTGAAIITSVCDSCGHLPEILVECIGYGAGTREYKKFPNVLRLFVGEIRDSEATGQQEEADNRLVIDDNLVLIETNIDDSSPQVLGYVMERVFELGALDCWFTPIQMKKNRPATMLSVLCLPEKRELLTDIIFMETTTLGIRVRNAERISLSREVLQIDTEFGKIDVKVGRCNGKIFNVMPEFEQVKTLALENEVPFRIVRDAVLAIFDDSTTGARSQKLYGEKSKEKG
ncbi:MAG: nickel pincer cofactor biosynthesis protein LarC [Pyrinomonadaceae bacterium]